VFLYLITLTLQVKALYPYSGHGLDAKKGEAMFLLEKTNADWWNVR
jgi:spectrin beta